LYITTKLANPNYSPEVCARVSIIDFTVTQRGLEDQLLGLVIANERAVCVYLLFSIGFDLSRIGTRT